MFIDLRRPFKPNTQYMMVIVGVPVWLAAANLTPVLRTMPGVVVLATFITCALALDRGPALLAVAIGTVGHELMRGQATPLLHVERMVVVAGIGSVAVALAFGRSSRFVAAQRYRALFERHPLPMWVFDEDTLRFLSVNLAAQRIYGYTEAEFTKMTLRDIRPREELPLLESRPWGNAEDSTATTRHRTKDGRVLDVQVRSQRVPFQGRPARLALVENITEQRVLEAQLRQAQKMEAVGQLAGGIAHDFNNLLTAVRGYASLLLDSLAEEDPRRDDVVEIDRAAERAVSLTRQLLAFSRKQILHERVISPNTVVDGLAPMLRRLVGEEIHLRTVTKAAGSVKADAVQLEQVILNLVVNARDAMKPGGGGEITIETADVVVDELYARTHPSARTGAHVVIAVSDNGQGMSADVQARAFEPFFTTKPSGQGTGLGLSTVYGIVKQSSGHVWIYSEVGRGTSVKVYLQRTDEVSEPPKPAPAKSRSAPVEERSVLLVEDEESVRQLLHKVLTRAGYTVFATSSIVEVRRLLEREKRRIDLLITDVVLTQGSGREVADVVQQAHPECRTLYISGYTDDAVVRRGILTEQMPFLQKPFSAASLLDKVASVLAVRP